MNEAADAAHITVAHVARNIAELSGVGAEKTVPTEVAVLKENAEQRFLLMVGYSPNRMPLRGADGFVDIAAPDLVEKACWRFMLNGAGAGIMHKSGSEDAFRVVENSVYRNPEPWVLKAADGSEQVIRQGDWLIGVVCSPETWEAYKAGTFRGGSLQGAARRIPATPETLARQRRS